MGSVVVERFSNVVISPPSLLPAPQRTYDADGLIKLLLGTFFWQ